jgi:hypothetical protein
MCETQTISVIEKNLVHQQSSQSFDSNALNLSLELKGDQEEWLQLKLDRINTINDKSL